MGVLSIARIRIFALMLTVHEKPFTSTADAWSRFCGGTEFVSRRSFEGEADGIPQIAWSTMCFSSLLPEQSRITGFLTDSMVRERVRLGWKGKRL
jgi:hypothetical protein